MKLLFICLALSASGSLAGCATTDSGAPQWAALLFGGPPPPPICPPPMMAVTTLNCQGNQCMAYTPAAPHVAGCP